MPVSSVEAQFHPEHREVAADVVRGLGGRVSHEVDPPAGEVGQDLRARLVARGKGEGVGRLRTDPTNREISW
jgi:hypothetical protein